MSKKSNEQLYKDGLKEFLKEQPEFSMDDINIEHTSLNPLTPDSLKKAVIFKNYIIARQILKDENIKLDKIDPNSSEYKELSEDLKNRQTYLESAEKEIFKEPTKVQKIIKTAKDKITRDPLDKTINIIEDVINNKSSQSLGDDKKPLPNSPASNDDSSFLDGIGEAIGSAGSALVTTGRVIFDTALDLGKDTLAHVVSSAITHGGEGSKAVLSNAARAAMGQMLSGMHNTVMQEFERQKGSLGRTPGIAGPIPETGSTTKEAIENTINDPSNANIFDSIADRVNNIVKNFDDVNTSVVLAAKVLETLRNGDIKIQPHILVPDTYPQEDGGINKQIPGTLEDIMNKNNNKKDKNKKRERVIEIGGLEIPVLLPEIILKDTGVIHENGGLNNILPRENQSGNGGFSSGGIGIHRRSDGKVFVEGYTRSDGVFVDSYTRDAPSH